MALREALKSTVSVGELAAKLEQRDALHEANTKELRAAVSQLTAEVSRQKDKTQQTVQIVMEEAKVMSDDYAAQIQDLKTQHREEMTAEREKYDRLRAEGIKLQEGLERRAADLAKREERTLKTVELLDKRLASKFPLAL